MSLGLRGQPRTKRQRVMDTPQKRCPRCDTEKFVSDFPKDRYRRDGLASRCTECNREKSAAYYERNRDLVIAKNSRRYWKAKATRLQQAS